MFSRNEYFRGSAGKAMLCVSLLAGASSGGLAAHAASPAPVLQTQTAAGSPQLAGLHILTPHEMSAPDDTALRSHQKDLATEAAFYGYNLSGGEWTYDQVACPTMPEEILLHYRLTARNGTESLFSAVVPRAAGRVQVVPVLYRNATPFHSAVESGRTIAVFNRAVPAEAAAQAIQPDGEWLQMAMCYAALAGAEPAVPQHAEEDVGLAHAPVPTLHMTEDDPTRQIIFTDRNAREGYLVWTITFDKKGRVLGAETRRLADYVGRAPSEKEPGERPMPPGSEPEVKPMAPGSEPQLKVPPHAGS